MGIMQLWGGHDTDEDMARTKARTLSAAEINSWVGQLRSTLKNTDAFKAVYNALASDKTLSAADLIEIAHGFTGSKAKTKKAADLARRIASYTSLWIALSLLFGALVSMMAAVMAREEDDRDSVRP